MPRHPIFSPSVLDIAGAVYSSLAHRLATYQGEVYPLHVGDTWMEPAEGCRMEDLKVAEHPGMVTAKTSIGGMRVVDVPAGELLPRIC